LKIAAQPEKAIEIQINRMLYTILFIETLLFKTIISALEHLYKDDCQFKIILSSESRTREDVVN
jgi:hypothetical protein